MEQHEITQAGPLLDEQGSLREAGYAKKLLPVYDRARIRGKALRIKEWDYYLVMNGQFALALTIADNSYMGLDSISFMDFWEKAQITKSPMRLMPMGSTGMPASTAEGARAIPSFSAERQTAGCSMPIWSTSGAESPWMPTSSSHRSRRSLW